MGDSDIHTNWLAYLLLYKAYSSLPSAAGPGRVRYVNIFIYFIEPRIDKTLPKAAMGKHF